MTGSDRGGGPRDAFSPEGVVVSPAGIRLAPRPSSLRGLTLGILENRKHNSRAILEALGARLAREHGIADFFVETKLGTTTRAPSDQLARIAQRCHFFLTGVGD